MNRSLRIVRPGSVEVRESLARRYGVAAIALVASLLLHVALIAIDRTDVPREVPRSASPIMARVAPPAPAPEPRVIAESPRAASPPTPAAVPRKALPVAPAVVPRPKPPATTSTWVDVTIAHDTESAIEAMFEQTLGRDYPGAQRTPLEFEVAPVVHLAPSVMSDSPQRMLRALVLIKPHGEVELLQTHEYDVPYMDAIREGLEGARAQRTPDDQMRWAILVFWFQRVGEAVPR